MQITVDIPDEYASRAAAIGVPVEQYVRDLLTGGSTAEQMKPKHWTPEESQAWLDRLAQFSEQIPELPDEAFTRESFYRYND